MEGGAPLRTGLGSPEKVKALLLAPQLSVEQVASLLAPYGFEEIKKADMNLQLIADEPRARALLADILEELLSSLAETPEPDRALNDLERFTRSTFSKTQFLSYLHDDPATLARAVKVFGGSPFLSDLLIRNPEYFYWIFDPAVLRGKRKEKERARELSQGLRVLKSHQAQLDFLRAFKRKEILRIGVRDLLREATVEETLEDLSGLASVLIRKAYAICDQALRRRYGAPRLQDRARGRRRIGFTIIAMGKLGGGELNFSSDVDLLYVYATRAGKTAGTRAGAASRISNADYFRRLAQEITAALNTVSGEGSVYRVDLRLRPEGEKGPIAQSLEGYRRYYAGRGETWERLSLVKAWPVGGDRDLGRRFLRSILPFIYRKPFGKEGFREVAALKGRIDEKIDAAQEAERHVKLGKGGIREIEFIVQSLQVGLGGARSAIRERNTIRALAKLRRAGLLAVEEHSALHDAYLFLRDVENKLQLVHDAQTHLLPAAPREIRACALRLGYRDEEGQLAGDRLLADYQKITQTVHRLFLRLLHRPDPAPAGKRR